MMLKHGDTELGGESCDLDKHYECGATDWTQYFVSELRWFTQFGV